MTRRVSINVSYEDATLIEQLVSDAANAFFTANDMNNAEALQEWAKYDRLKVDIAIARAYAENQ